MKNKKMEKIVRTGAYWVTKLTMLLILLRAVGIISWPWMVVFAPILVYVMAFIVIPFVMVILITVYENIIY